VERPGLYKPIILYLKAKGPIFYDSWLFKS
jgi:hypothetical protein